MTLNLALTTSCLPGCLHYVIPGTRYYMQWNSYSGEKKKEKSFPCNCNHFYGISPITEVKPVVATVY